MYSMNLFISITNSRHEITGEIPICKVSGSTRKQLFVNGIRAFEKYRNSEQIKAQVKSKTHPSFSKWEFMLSNSKNPSKQYGESAYWIRKKDRDWIVLEFNKAWKGSIYDRIYTHIYTIPNAKVNHPSAEDFMVKENKEY